MFNQESGTFQFELFDWIREQTEIFEQLPEILSWYFKLFSGVYLQFLSKI